MDVIMNSTLIIAQNIEAWICQTNHQIPMHHKKQRDFSRCLLLHRY